MLYPKPWRLRARGRSPGRLFGRFPGIWDPELPMAETDPRAPAGQRVHYAVEGTGEPYRRLQDPPIGEIPT